MSRPSFLVVHSPLVGPATVVPLADTLARRGAQVRTPDLTQVWSARPPWHPILVATALAEVAADPVVLVVHSGAGALVPAIDAQLAGGLAAVVFVDATLPHPGRSWLETVPDEAAELLGSLPVTDGLMPPWHRWFPRAVMAELLPDAATRGAVTADVPRLPRAYFDEQAPDLAEWPERPCGYLRLSAAYDTVAAEADDRGWPIYRYDGHHLSLTTEPSVVAEAILELLDRMDGRPPGQRR